MGSAVARTNSGGFISTRSLLACYREAGGTVESVKEIALRAPANPLATRVHRELGHSLGLGLAHHLAEFAPESLLLGGGITGSSPLFLPSMLKSLGTLTTEVTLFRFGSAAPLVGAAMFAFSRLEITSTSTWG